MAVAIAIAVAVSVAVSVSIAIAIDVTVVAYPRCCCCLPLLLRLPLPITAAISIELPSAIAITVALAVAIAVSVTIGHCSRHLRQPSPLPSLLAIAKSCCFSAARIVFRQFKQIMLTLLIFCSDSGQRTDQSRMTDQALHGDDQHQRWVASSKQQVARGEVNGSRGAAGWRCCLTMGGVVLLCCWGGSR